MTCEELREEFELLALGLSEEPERFEAESHLRRGCLVCTRNYRQAISTNSFILALPGGGTSSRDLRRRILGSIGVKEKTWVWVAIPSALSAGLLAGLIWFNMENQRTRNELVAAQRAIARSAADLEHARAALSLLNLPDTRQVIFGQGQQPPKGRIFVNSARGVLLIASNLPGIGPDKTYELWIIPKGAAPRPAGLFQADDTGSAVYLSEGPMDPNTAAVAVSVEPASGSPAPTTTPIIVAPLAE